jgi:hypothetical protein
MSPAGAAVVNPVVADPDGGADAVYWSAQPPPIASRS